MAKDRQEKLARLLRRHFSNDAMRRHLHGLPIFRVEPWLPARLRELRDRLVRKDDKRPEN